MHQTVVFDSILLCTRNTGTAVNPFNRRLTEHVCGGGGCLSRSGWRGAGGGWRYQWHLQQERQLLFDPKLAARMSRNKPIRWFWCHGATICSMRIWIYWSIHKSAPIALQFIFKSRYCACGLDRVLNQDSWCDKSKYLNPRTQWK